MIPSHDDVTKGAMSVNDGMTIDERRKYLRTMQARHLRADRPE